MEIAAGGPRPTSTFQYRALLYGPFALAVLLTFGVTSDDPLITLRYAHNLATGHGPVFNVGERVEGFSSPLHLAVMTVLQVMPWGHELFEAKLISLAFGLLALREAGKLYQSFALPRWALQVLLVAGGANFMLVLSASNGLETSLMVWLVTAFVLRLVLQPAHSKVWEISAFAVGLILVRPEGVLIVALCGAAAFVCAPAGQRLRSIRWGIAPVIAFAILLLGRHAYYGEWLPNTYYAKSPELGHAAWLGLLYLRNVFELHPTVSPRGFERSSPVAFVLMALQVACFFLGLISRKDRRQLIAGVVIAAELLIILKAGGDWMKGARFAAPVAPEIVLFEVLGVAAFLRILRQYNIESIDLMSSIVPAAICLFLVIASVAPLLPERNPIWATQGNMGNEVLIAHGGYEDFSRIWAQAPSYFKCAKPGDTVAFSEVGNLGLGRLDLAILDTHGLTDRYIAHNAPQNVRRPAGVYDLHANRSSSVVGHYLEQRRPAYIASLDILPSATILDGGYVQQESRIYGPYVLVVFRRADLPLCAKAIAGLQLHS